MKKKLLTVALSLCLAVGLAVPAFAADDTKGPWTDGEGYGTVEDQGEGWYLLKGDADASHLKPGPYVSFTATNDTTDYSKGFVYSISLDLTNMKAGDEVAWSFGVSGQEKEADDTYKYLDEATVHFNAVKDGEPQLVSIQSSATGSEDGNLIAKALDTPVTTEDGKFKINVRFSPDEDGKMMITFFANREKIGEWSTIHDYAEDVKGPRSCWMFQCYPEEGILAAAPSVSNVVITGVSVVDGTDGYTPVTSPAAGQKLTANVQTSAGEVGSYPVNADMHYEWFYEGSDTILGTEPVYTVTEDNLDKVLCVRVWSNEYLGDASWKAGAAVNVTTTPEETNPSETTPEKPATGESTDLIVPVACLLFAAAAIAVVLVMGKKREMARHAK